jgi:hypothetical protein
MVSDCFKLLWSGQESPPETLNFDAQQLITSKGDRAAATASVPNPAIPTVAELVAVAIPVVDNPAATGEQVAACSQKNWAICRGHSWYSDSLR